jgi:hypothetical protein
MPCHFREARNQPPTPRVDNRQHTDWERIMGRGILLWLLGIPIPIIILILLFWH